MRTACRGLVLMVLLLAARSEAQAEAASVLPLRATYCLAVAKAQEAKHEEEIKRSDGSGARETVALALRMARERRAKLERYLGGKDAASDDESPDFATATERGAQDVESCDRDVKLAPYKTCSDQCMARLRAADQQLICLSSCPSPEPCRRVKACLERFLP
jgi:hypothetical protein